MMIMLPNTDEAIHEMSTTSSSSAAAGGGSVCLPSKQTAAHTTIVPFPAAATRGGGGGLPNLASPAFPLTLKFEKVVYKVKVAVAGGSFFGGKKKHQYKERTILSGISGMVLPGEVLAMLGPSGSGKTTLLTALGGRRLPGRLSGEITYNSRPFSGATRRRTGFVAQDDVLYAHLTVRETLVFTALLRLPSSLTRSEKAQHAQRVMAELGLARAADTMIGGPRLRGVSGGERKRVSIGQEMLVNPSLLLLDEPTSGLDSTTALRIVATLKRLAIGSGSGGGRAVVTTIHQPSSRIYQMFDKVVLLSSDGCPIYYGRAAAAIPYFSASLGFSIPSAANPADILLDLANGIAPDSEEVATATSAEYYCQVIGDNGSGEAAEQKAKEVKEALIATYDRHIAKGLQLVAPTTAAATWEGHHNNGNNNNMENGNNNNGDGNKRKCGSMSSWSIGWWEQFFVLLRRGLKERRYESFNNLRIFQVLSVAILAGLLWWRTPPSHLQDKTALLFFFSVFWGFFPLYNAVFTFPQERWMLLKERSSGMYRLSSYFLARTAGDLPMELALPTAFVVIIYWMGGLRPDPAAFLLSLLVVLYSVIVAQSLGLAIGAVVMEVKQATTLASVTTLVFLVAGGYYVQSIPPFIVWLKYLSYSFYCYKLLLRVQFADDDLYECSPPGAASVMCRAIDSPTIKSVGLSHVWADVCVMALMILGYRLVAYWALHRLVK